MMRRVQHDLERRRPARHTDLDLELVAGPVAADHVAIPGERDAL